MIPIIPLVTLNQVRDHTRSTSLEDEDLKLKLRIATAIVMNHLKLTAIPEGWVFGNGSPIEEPPDVDTSTVFVETSDSPPILIRVPGNIQAAVLLVVGELLLNREASNSDPLSRTVIDLLSMYRDPSFA